SSTTTRSTASKRTTSTWSVPQKLPWPVTTLMKFLTSATAQSGLLATRPATAAKPEPQEKTPAASFVSTSSISWKCSSIPPSRKPKPSTSACWLGKKTCWPRLRCPTGSSTPPPATSAPLLHGRSTVKRGFPRTQTTAHSRRPRTARPSKRVVTMCVNASLTTTALAPVPGWLPPSTAPSPLPAGLSRFWKTTRTPTARSTCQKPCNHTWAEKLYWSPSNNDRGVPPQVVAKKF